MNIHAIDQNNMKALAVAKGLLKAAETGYVEDIDHVSLLGILCDYLQLNNQIFNEAA
jgi:hypothetical protein